MTPLVTVIYQFVAYAPGINNNSAKLTLSQAIEDTISSVETVQSGTFSTQ